MRSRRAVPTGKANAMSNLYKKAVIVVDLQADFTELHQGSLAVRGTDQGYLDMVIAATKAYAGEGCPVICTQDYHPADHVSFYTNHPGRKAFDTISLGNVRQTLWPPHCIQGAAGARLLLPQELITEVAVKGADSRFDSYSGFRDDGGHETNLQVILDSLGIHELIIYGLATDYCVRYTVLDALNRGFRVRVRLDLCRGVSRDTTDLAINEMVSAGAILEPQH